MPESISDEDKIVSFILDNVKQEPKRTLDVCCGFGELVKKLSSAYPNSMVYGLDVNRQALALGIAKGRFERAVPVHGNAYDLLRKNPDFTTVHFDPRYHREARAHDYVDFKKIKHKKLKEPLTNFDLVTAVDPAFEISSAGEMEKLKRGKKSDGNIPIEVISSPANEGGHVLYEKEIANLWAWYYNSITPHSLTKEQTGMILGDMKKEGSDSGLKYVSHFVLPKKAEIINSVFSVDLGVLFKKT